MTVDWMNRFEAYLQERADRPFGDVESISGRTLQPFSTAGAAAARNLLTKARRALRAGEQDRATAYVDRAVALPFDEHEMAPPAALAAHMALFCLITDTLEGSAEGDSRWLDAALDVLGMSQGSARFELRDVLKAIDHDYLLGTREHRRIRAAIAPIPAREALSSLLDLPTAELRDCIIATLDACDAYEAALRSADSIEPLSAVETK